MADSHCFVQFSHSGREHKPDCDGGKASLPVLIRTRSGMKTE